MIAVGGWYGWKAHRASVKAAASNALVNAYTTDELEEAVSKFSGSATAGALKIRLAKSYFDAGRYEEAMATYDELAGNPPEGFADVPPVGKAQCLEALGRYAEAQKAFDDFAEANPKSFLALTAKLGAARAMCQAGDKKGALARIEALKSAEKEEGVAKARIEATETVIKRFEKKAPVAAPAVAEKPAEAKAEKPVEAKK